MVFVILLTSVQAAEELGQLQRPLAPAQECGINSFCRIERLSETGIHCGWRQVTSD